MTSPSESPWLRPSLLERLTDHRPERRAEPRAAQEVDDAELRRLLHRDLSWLLNTTYVASTLDLTDFPEVSRSVLNYGIPPLTGLTLSSVDEKQLARHISEALVMYESRLVQHTIDVRVRSTPRTSQKPGLYIQIAAELQTEPLPLALRVRAEVDLESGRVVVDEDRSREDT